MSALREALSDVVHHIWSDWMKHQFSKGTLNQDGSWTMPTWAVERWQRQMNTSYTELSEDEKNEDRREADRILKMIEFMK